MNSESLAPPRTFSAHAMAPRLAILGAVCLWGASFSAMRSVLDVLPPWTVMWCRLLIALCCVLPFIGTIRLRQYRAGDWKLLLPTVLLQPCLYFWFESTALSLTTSAQAGVISASVPLLVAFGAWATLREPLSRRMMMGLSLSVIGVAVLTLSGETTPAAPAPLRGNVLEFLAMICAAGNMLLVRTLGQRYSAWTLTVLQVLAGSLFFLPGAAHFASFDVELLSSRVLFTLIFLGSCVSLGAFLLYNWGITRLSAGTASAHINLIPVIAVGCGFLFLGETMTPLQMGAAGLILGSVVMTQKTSR